MTLPELERLAREAKAAEEAISKWAAARHHLNTERTTENNRAFSLATLELAALHGALPTNEAER